MCKGNENKIKKGNKIMRNDYEMVTVKDYVESLDNVKYLSVEEKEIEKSVEKYLLSIQRAKTNEKIVEALLA